MTTIDTTLYADGALRLSRHGAGKGGTVLMLTATGEQVDIPERFERDVIFYFEQDLNDGFAASVAFSAVKHFIDNSQLRQVRFNRC